MRYQVIRQQHGVRQMITDLPFDAIVRARLVADGWGHIEKDVDLRDYDNAADAIAAVLGA